MSDPVPHIRRAYPAREHSALRAELLAAVTPVLLGDVEAGEAARATFEEALAEVTGQRVALGVQSATAGLLLALRACDIGPGDEVITVANSDISTTAAISHTGATPVVCDVHPSDATIDPGRVEALVTPRTRAIVPVDLYGHPADVRSLRAIADRWGLRIIEDAALAIGAYDHGRSVGAFADAAVFSFSAYKPLGTVGSGGAVVTSDPALARRLRILRGYGAAPDGPVAATGHQSYVDEGYHLPLDGLQAAVLSVKLPYLSAWTRRRREVAAAYATGLRELPVNLPSFRAESEPTFRQYTIGVPQRDVVYRRLREAGVDAVLHYVPPMHWQPAYRGRDLRGSDRLPVTERLAARLLCLPVSPTLGAEDIAYVVDTLRDALRLTV
ncbi:MAG: DegT/DnrJ/EryC1/StrS family aminotransferase [Armatimonadota bacterium]|nr:DegT/DnrJ/EryC1/StrS family aminotransferase [Armatimonadota bacterium]MDR7453178.1 DegT/DnrJ/EryC1/StrS family aminotransferase [Armatimonadota bacterium]